METLSLANVVLGFGLGFLANEVVTYVTKVVDETIGRVQGLLSAVEGLDARLNDVEVFINTKTDELQEVGQREQVVNGASQ